MEMEKLREASETPVSLPSLRRYYPSSYRVNRVLFASIFSITLRSFLRACISRLAGYCHTCHNVFWVILIFGMLPSFTLDHPSSRNTRH